jgi:hypothetical protein
MKIGFAKIKKVFLDIVSFNTPQARVFNLCAVLVGLAVVPTKHLVYFPIRCVFKHVILPFVFGGNCPTTGLFAGCECPACGMTRAMSRLLHGDIVGAYNFNKGVFLVLLVMLVLIVVNLVISVREYRKTGKIF